MEDKRVDVKTGFICNNKCLFCVQGDKRYIYGNKKTDEIKKVLEEAIKYSKSIVFTGGEVTIRKDIVELVRYAKELGFKTIQIQTNGRMLAYPRLTEALIKAGANEFSPAVHGHNEELHDYLTSAKGSFRQTIAGIKILKKYDVPIITNTVITRSNYIHLPDIARLLTSLGVTQFQFAFVHALGNAKKNFYSIVPRMTFIEPYVKKGLSIGIKHGIRVMTEAIPFCFMVGYEQYVAERIMPHTRVFDAHAVLDDYTVYRQTEGKLKREECRKCKYFEICEGPWREYPETYGWDEFKPVSK